MNRCHKSSWFRTGLLLVALSAGGLATLLVPPYREIAWAPDADEPSAGAPANSGRKSSSVTGIDVDLRSVALMGSIG